MTLGEQLIAQGRVEERAAAMLCVLQARAISVSPPTRARIQGCRDMNMLAEWLARAATRSSAEELFA